MRWLRLLDKAIAAEGSLTAVAIRLGYSKTAISTARSGKYLGNTAAIEKKVIEIYGETKMQTIPEGYMKNGIGHLVPIDMIDEIDLVRDEFVRSMMEKAIKMQVSVKKFKDDVVGDMQAFFELSAEKYGVETKDSRVCIQLTSYDGKYQIVREISDRIEFDERLQIAKQLIDECLRDWSKEAGPELRTIVEAAFQVDKKGKINTGRILSLRSHKIDHPTWKKAMEAIGNAIMVVGSCTYYRFYQRDEQGKYGQISLDFSRV